MKNGIENISKQCIVCSKGGIETIHSPNLNGLDSIVHGFTTRLGGTCSSPFDSLNFSQKRFDTADNIVKNYSILCENRNLDLQRLTIINHEHGNNVIRVSSSDAGKGLFGNKLPPADGLVTNDNTITLIGCHADCGSIYLYDKENKAIGLAHSGWKGTILRIGKKLVEKMVEEFDSNPSEIVAAIGPSICVKCFEVDIELAERFREEFDTDDVIGKSEKLGKAYVDINSALVIQLIESGISTDNISIMDKCTFEERDLFFSYRRDGINSGAMTSYLKLN